MVRNFFCKDFLHSDFFSGALKFTTRIPEGSRRELVKNCGGAGPVVNAVVVQLRQGQAELGHQLRTKNSRQELVEGDVLVDRDDDLSGLLEDLFVVPVRIDQLKLRRQPVVLYKKITCCFKDGSGSSKTKLDVKPMGNFAGDCSSGFFLLGPKLENNRISPSWYQIGPRMTVFKQEKKSTPDLA